MYYIVREKLNTPTETNNQDRKVKICWNSGKGIKGGKVYPDKDLADAIRSVDYLNRKYKKYRYFIAKVVEGNNYAV